MKNTIEAFKAEDKNAFIQRAGESMWASIQSGAVWQDPSCLCRFSVLLFGDLKKYVFYYWFAFPAFNVPASVQVSYRYIPGRYRYLVSPFLEIICTFIYRQW
jgi:hypothetical protein